jgi:hypothetical protein
MFGDHRWGFHAMFLVATTSTLVALAYTASTSRAADVSRCQVGRSCQLEGKLEIVAPGYPRSGATIQTANGCVTLLLSEEYFDPRENWNGRVVRVSGVAHTQPKDPLLMWYEFMGRTTDAGVCDSEAFIFVDSIVPINGP